MNEVKITIEEAIKRVEEAFSQDINHWELQTLTDERKEEIMDTVINFIQSPNEMVRKPDLHF